MDELPAGTITMLFSDIEGSTALLSRLGDRYHEALSAQRALLRAAFADCGGREMGTEGDSFFVVFSSAGDAVGCCVAAQRALVGHDWPGGVAVRVRMGLHSGEPARHQDGYVGLDVHRAARIAATAHGSQVVLSDATRQLVASRLPAGVSVRDLGFHRLKDIEAPEHIYQLVAAGLPERFPPLKSLRAQPSLPVPMTPLIGRASMVDEVAGLLDDRRLVTVTGPGGVGKTRLATEVAWRVAGRFADGACLAELAAVQEPALVPAAVAVALGIPQAPGLSLRRRWPQCWPASSCCWCWITANTSSTGRPGCAGRCCPLRTTCGSWRPAGSRCGWPGRRGTACRRCRCLSQTSRPRCASRRRCACSPTGHGGLTRTFPWIPSRLAWWRGW